MIGGVLALVVIGGWCLVTGIAFHSLAGRRSAGDPRFGGGDPLSPAIEVAAGLVLFHLLLQTLALAGLGWRRPTLLAALAVTLVVAVACGGFARWIEIARRVRSTTWSRWDLVSLGAIIGFAAASFTLRSTISDFVYHWGLKAKRYVEVGSLDLDFLARPENAYTHPDYPQLFPELFASATLLAGVWTVPVLMLGSAPFLALIWWVARGTLGGYVEDRTAALASAGICCGVAAFSIGYFAAGGTDLPCAFGMALGAALLLRDRVDDALAVGTTAAFLAVTKIEGLPCAVILIALFVVRQRRRLFAGGTMAAVPWLVALAAPVAVAGGWWLVLVYRYGLFQSGNTGAWRLDQFPEIGAGVWWSLSREAWVGLPFLLVLLPWLVWRPTTRWLGLLIALQGAFYAFSYLTTPYDPWLLVITTLPRLLLHLIPALLVGIFVALASQEAR